jgi:DNA-binding SARP family transcriptional activator
VDFRILGPLEVVDERGPVRLRAAKQRALLAILLLHRNEVVSADRLIDELWGDRPPKTARKTLQMHVSHLRRVLPPGVLRTESPGYVLTVEPGELDLDRFEALVNQARSAAPATAARLLREALALSRGPPLSDLEYEPFARGEVARLEEVRLAALEDRIDADHALGHHAELVGELESLAGAYPLRERIRGQLMLALYRSGRQAEALEAYRQARVALVEELGIEPGPELRALEQAILRHEVPAPEAPAAEVAGVEARTVGVFVGRDRELAELLAGLDEALAGRGGLILVGGEPGIGKSRLAGELAGQAKARGARVLSGRCWEAGGAAPYWPWVQSLRSYLRDADPQALRAELGSGAPVVAQMLPEVREVVSDLPPPQSLESDGARFRLFDATATFLRRAAATHPLVLVLDDLHAADTPSLLLLQFLAGEVTDAKILIVVTYRDVELLRDHPLRSTLAELSRHDTTRRLTLSGLSQLDVSRFIALTTEVQDADALAAAIHGQTDGNPLFVDELVKLLVAEGRLRSADSRRPAIPDTVREVIAQRLAHLPEECTDVLMRAAVLGGSSRPRPWAASASREAISRSRCSTPR